SDNSVAMALTQTQALTLTIDTKDLQELTDQTVTEEALTEEQSSAQLSNLSVTEEQDAQGDTASQEYPATATLYDTVVVPPGLTDVSGGSAMSLPAPQPGYTATGDMEAYLDDLTVSPTLTVFAVGAGGEVTNEEPLVAPSMPGGIESEGTYYNFAATTTLLPTASPSASTAERNASRAPSDLFSSTEAPLTMTADAADTDVAEETAKMSTSETAPMGQTDEIATETDDGVLAGSVAADDADRPAMTAGDLNPQIIAPILITTGIVLAVLTGVLILRRN
ncbi:MAG TPA: hypothetical protein VHL11_07320, partial [Phototrophicaceae bacterium]|nr:hypothetical protein [Phototrophicaceae bacterium]